MLATLNAGQFNGCWDSINFFKDDFEGFVRFFFFLSNYKGLDF